MLANKNSISNELTRTEFKQEMNDAEEEKEQGMEWDRIHSCWFHSFKFIGKSGPENVEENVSLKFTIEQY